MTSIIGEIKLVCGIAPPNYEARLFI